ncbi:PAS domain S-box protein [Salinadaptatus halalkaliphilus]|nr:PAS domain S-box protein [Salinadaptatus halalkaliphilus]
MSGINAIVAGSLLFVGTVLLGLYIEQAVESVVLGLAVGGSADRSNAIERLATDVRTVVDRLEGTTHPTEIRTDEINIELDRDDELGELSAAIDDLTSAFHRCSQRIAEHEQYRDALYRITAETNASTDEQIRQLLELGCDRLEMEAGLVSRTDEDADRYVVEYTHGTEVVPDGTETKLSETFCRETVESDGLRGIHDADDERDTDDPAVESGDINSYLGTTLEIGDERYGTLCFLDRTPREGEFSTADRTFVDLMANWIGHAFDRQRYERELRLKDRALEAAPVGVTITDPDQPDNPIIYANEAFEEVTGYDREDAIGRNCRFLQGERTDPDRVEQLQEAVADGKPTAVELRNYRPDGTEFWNRVHLAPIEDDAGTVTNFVGFQEDVTDRRIREQRLRETNEWLDAIIDASPAALIAVDLEDTVQLWNPAAERIFGWDESEVRGNELPTIPEPDEESLDIFLDRLRAGETITGVELQRRTKDGSLLDVRISKAPIRDSSGEVVGVMGAIEDVSESKRYERELERTRALLEQSQHLASVGAWELDVREEPYELEGTDEVARILGYHPETSSFSLEDSLELYHPEDRARLRTALDRAIEEGEPYDLELRLTTTDGHRRWVRAIGEPIVTGDAVAASNEDRLQSTDDAVVAVRGSIQNITDRKERERELEQTQELLERVEQLAGVGGWELDLTEDPPQPTWTEEQYRIHGLPRDTPPDLSAAIEKYHPDDRPRVRQRLQTAIETESIYELEARIEPTPEELIWVRGVGEPVFEDGELVAYQGALRDVTDLKHRELALESLHEAARGLLGVETVEAVADLVIDTATDLFDDAGVALYRLDDDVNQLVPVGHSDAFDRLTHEAPTTPLASDGSVLWNAFVTGAQTVVDDPAAGDQTQLFEDDVESAVVVPIGNHGVVTVAAESDAIDAETRQLVETLAATTEAALDRLEHESRLRERDAELEAQNQRLRRQMSVTEIIRRINGSLVGATSRAEIDSTVPERLVEATGIGFAWIGTVDSSESTLEPQSWAGTNGEYLDSVSLATETSVEPACRTARTEQTTVVENVVDDIRGESWRRKALDAGFQSVISIPLTLAEYSYGVLTVYATEPDAFAELEREVFGELGETIANAINVTRTREALHSAVQIELTLAMTESNDILSQIATKTGGRIEYDGIGTHSSEDTLLFFETHDVDPQAVTAILEELVVVSAYRLLSEDEDRCRFEALVSGEVLASQLIRHGASPRSIVGDDEETIVTVDVTTGTDVRAFIDALADTHRDVELRSRRHVERSMHTRRELISSLFEELTDRQLEVLRTAFYAGFFEWPRESTGQEIADRLDVSQPTVNRHLRIGQRRLLAQLFGDAVSS